VADRIQAPRTDAADLAALVTTLSRLSLSAVLPATTLGLTDWTLRPHEVLEDALRDSLTGDGDYGSHSDLDSVAADVSATRELLGLLAPLITRVRPGWCRPPAISLRTLLPCSNLRRTTRWPSQRSRASLASGSTRRSGARWRRCRQCPTSCGSGRHEPFGPP
jgi:hypothetical protein